MEDDILVGLESISSELLAIASLHLTDLLCDKRAEPHKPKRCEIRELHLAQLKNSLQVAARIDRREMLYHFKNLVERASCFWRRKHHDGLRVCLSLPVLEEPRPAFTFFEKNAFIEKLTIDKRLSIQLTFDNLDWLQAVLTGCRVDHLALVLDRPTRLFTIPALAAELKVRHLELVLQKPLLHNWTEYMQDLDFIDATAAAGVEEFTVSNDEYSDQGGDFSPHLNYALVERLLEVGFRRITLDAENPAHPVNVPKLVRAIHRIALHHHTFCVVIRSSRSKPLVLPATMRPEPLLRGVTITDRPLEPGAPVGRPSRHELCIATIQ